MTSRFRRPLAIRRQAESIDPISNVADVVGCQRNGPAGSREWPATPKRHFLLSLARPLGHRCLVLVQPFAANDQTAPKRTPAPPRGWAGAKFWGKQIEMAVSPCRRGPPQRLGAAHEYTVGRCRRSKVGCAGIRSSRHFATPEGAG